MKGDFSRQTFDPKKHYSAVLMQQGRVQVDADWNEQQAINQDRIETEAKDVIGKCGAPKSEPGFKIDIKDDTNLKIDKGRYYVDGILCEHEADVDGILCEHEADLDYEHQPDLPNPDQIVKLLNPGQFGLVYLDVWQRHITHLDNPQIREIALGGPDTATRSKTVWQVKVLPVPNLQADVNCSTDLEAWNKLTASSTGKLNVQTIPVSDPNNPCLVPPSSGYQRLENQLYRVEIHHGSDRASGPTFKWSRENGSVVAEITKIEGNRITVASLGKDEVLGFASGQWVEIINDEIELKGQPGQLKLATVDEANSVIVIDETPEIAQNGLDFSLHPKIRRWEQYNTPGGTPTATENGVEITYNKWEDLEGGIQVKFSPGTYKTGDYWLIPARGVTDKIPGQIEWPTSSAQPPLGIQHHYCRLALIKLESGKLTLVEDCRRQFPPLTEIGRSCCLITVGKGGDYNNIQGAVDAAFTLQQASSGYDFVKICILPGRYQLNAPVVIEGGKQIIISGCDHQATILGPSNKPAFQLEECNSIIFDALKIVAQPEREAILVNDSQKIIVTNCEINGQGSKSSVSIQADFVRIGGNRLNSLWIRDGSKDILIEDNEIRNQEISNQASVGIALGNLESSENLNNAAGVSDVTILGNNIHGMSNSGITTVAKRENNPQGIGDVQDLTIAHNRIVGCARKEVDSFFDPEAVGGIVLREVAQVRIHDNYIAENGVGNNSACGIFVNDCQGLEIANNTILDNGYAKKQACIYFLVREISQINPRTEQGVSFLVKDSQGNRESSISITPNGLNCSYTTEIQLPSPVTSVSLALHHSATPATVVAFDQSGAEVAQKTMSSNDETLILSGSVNNQITRVVITALQNETLLRQFCFGINPDPSGPVTYQAGIVILGATSNQIPTPDKKAMLTEKVASEQQPAAFAVRIQDNVVVCPQGQALILLGLGSMSIIGNTLTSQGIGQQPLKELNIGGRCVAILNLGQIQMPLGNEFASVSLSNASFRTNFVEFSPPNYDIKLSEVPDGRVMFHSNQVTLRVAQRIEPLVYNAVAITSLDDISLQDNQILSEIAGQGTLIPPNSNAVSVPPLLMDVLTLAPTVRASGNRFTELPLGALFSYLSWGWYLNSATGNQATHCLLILGGQVINTPNQNFLCSSLQKLYSIG
jgi:hypothetical protein